MASNSISGAPLHKLSSEPCIGRLRRRRMAKAIASAAPMIATAPGINKSPSLEWDAPPNPVCGEPKGMTPSVPVTADVPVEPPAPAAEPVVPVTPEPTLLPVPVPVAAPLPLPAGVVAPEPVVPPVPDGVVGVVPGTVGVVDVGTLVGVVGIVVVVVGDAAMKLLVNVVIQVTVLPPPLEEPLHWLIVTGSAVAAPVTSHCTRVLAPPPFPEPLH
jgi:hypothetical protein